MRGIRGCEARVTSESVATRVRVRARAESESRTIAILDPSITDNAIKRAHRETSERGTGTDPSSIPRLRACARDRSLIRRKCCWFPQDVRPLGYSSSSWPRTINRHDGTESRNVLRCMHFHRYSTGKDRYFHRRFLSPLLLPSSPHPPSPPPQGNRYLVGASLRAGTKD